MPRPRAAGAPVRTDLCVVCCWKSVPPLSKGESVSWELADSYPIDDEGYALNDRGVRLGRCPWQAWMQDVPAAKTGMVLVVTSWSLQYGVRLTDMLVWPVPWWASPEFVDRMKKSDYWHTQLANGWALVSGSAAEAGRYLLT